MNSTSHKPETPLTEADRSSFVGFYNTNSIIPVSQDISHPDFIFRRNSLYKMLGIPLSIFKDRSILEMGPGGGYNALAVISHKPSKYVFVDASKASIDEIYRKQKKGLFGETDIEIIESNIFDFNDPRSFDFVIIEGTIPGQRRPKMMLRHAASFVTNGGFLSTTATTPTSLLAEICRRIFLPFITSTTDSLDGQISRAIEIFEPQLNSLNTSTRPIRDWVLDSIFHPWENCQNMCFSILDCIDTLNSEFEFYGSSPKFLVDDRFYKRIGRSSVNSNILARQQYPALNLSLIDYRTSLIKNISWGASNDIESVCRQLYDIHDIIVHSGGYSELDNFIYHLKIVIDLLPSAFNETVSSINDFIENFPRFIQGDTSVDFQFFSKWWGRGQQYVSFLRNEE